METIVTHVRQVTCYVCQYVQRVCSWCGRRGINLGDTTRVGRSIWPNIWKFWRSTCAWKSARIDSRIARCCDDCANTGFGWSGQKLLWKHHVTTLGGRITWDTITNWGVVSRNSNVNGTGWWWFSTNYGRVIERSWAVHWWNQWRVDEYVGRIYRCLQVIDFAFTEYNQGLRSAT